MNNENQTIRSVDLFSGRSALLVTKHGKEKVIAPVLKESIGLRVTVSDNIDTDEFGTFSGEVERPDTQYNTAKLKIDKAFELDPDLEIAVASEGAFNPHPDSPFVLLNTEIVLLADRRNNLEIAGRHLTMNVKAHQATVSSLKEAQEVVGTCGFPEYGVILSATHESGGKPIVIKDIESPSAMEAAILFCFAASADGAIKIQTDLRAHRNPTRMEQIRLATHELVRVMQSTCPACATPGFDVADVIRGLPCSLCHSPTRAVLAYRYECHRCNHSEERYFPKGKQAEDPMFCDYCNP